ncbi:MAG: imidazole glycerol phosphate synthase subunit HisH [Verrucomicrobium sp.]
MKLGILDYGGGNLRSVHNAFRAIGYEARLVTTSDDFRELDILVFPGQGAFGDSVRQLQATGLWQPLQEWLAADRPYLGICLGYQLLFQTGEENPGVKGLGKFEGSVPRFPTLPGIKVPHMGWNTVRFGDSAHPLWAGLGSENTFYFVHSYYPAPVDRNLGGCFTDYAGEFASGIVQDNLVAVQFHPEKSQEAGLTLLKNAVAFLAPKA